MSTQDTVASPATEDDKAVASQVDSSTTETTQDVNTDTATSSSAEGDQPKSMVEALSKALNKDKGDEAPPASTAEPENKNEDPDPNVDEDEGEDTGELSEDEKKVLSQKTQDRIRKFAGRVKELEPLATRTRNMDKFLADNGISPQDAAGALHITQMMRTNPAAALTELRKITYELSVQLGETLPTDIREKIEKGVIDEETGRELAKARAQASGLRVQAETLSEQQHTTRVETTRKAVSDAVTAWESTVRSRDPDFARKQPFVEAQFRAMLQAGEKVESPEGAVSLMKKALKFVNDNFRSALPQDRKEVKPQPASTSTSSTTARPATMEDAIRQRLVG
jgi:hypothetical protein